MSLTSHIKDRAAHTDLFAAGAGLGLDLQDDTQICVARAKRLPASAVWTIPTPGVYPTMADLSDLNAAYREV